MKKFFYSPMILTWVPPEDDDDTGAGTGQSGDPRPVSFSDWMILYAVDLDNDGDKDLNDYNQWMINHGWEDQIDPS